jgi:5-methyltetrahydropteroyltriglutamate--homocysteine methyltransferase
MRRSTERILTTHTGSLPRPDDLVRQMQLQMRGVPVDAAAFAARTRAAVAEAVRKQVSAGVDVVNDGEQSKVGFSTYVKERLTGFGGAVAQRPPARSDVLDFPTYAARDRPAVPEGRWTMDLPSCDGPISYVGQAALAEDIANLQAALQGAGVAEAFLSAASPGVISFILPNQYYPSHEAYLGALGAAMKTEYEAIHRAGFILQVDCPDLAMGRHFQFAEASLEEFRRNARLHVEVLNEALRDIPAERVRLHLCWGNYEGPHHRDVPLRDILDLVLEARPAGLSYEAANPRHAHEWQIFESVKLPPDKILIPGVLDSTTNYVEHPELVAQRLLQLTRLVGRENVVAGTDCGFATFADSARVDPAIAWAKLAALAEGAALASKALW